MPFLCLLFTTFGGIGVMVACQLVTDKLSVAVCCRCIIATDVDIVVCCCILYSAGVFSWFSFMVLDSDPCFSLPVLLLFCIPLAFDL